MDLASLRSLLFSQKSAFGVYRSEVLARTGMMLVREHLTLSEYATGKDPNDPAVAEELADRLHHNKLLLDMVFDLTSITMPLTFSLGICSSSFAITFSPAIFVSSAA